MKINSKKIIVSDLIARISIAIIAVALSATLIAAIGLLIVTIKVQIYSTQIKNVEELQNITTED